MRIQGSYSFMGIDLEVEAEVEPGRAARFAPWPGDPGHGAEVTALDVSIGGRLIDIDSIGRRSGENWTSLAQDLETWALSQALES